MFFFVSVICPFLLLSTNLLYQYHSLFIHYPANGYLDCFQFLVIMNKVSRSSYASIYLDIDFHFLHINT